MNAMGTPGGLVIGSDFQSLGVVRSLQERQVPVFLLEYEHGIARFSRHVRRHHAKHDLFTAADSVDLLLDLARRERLEGWVLFANCDQTVKLLAQHRAELETCYRVPLPAWEVTQRFYDKATAYRAAAAAGIAIPRMYEASCLEELLEQDIEYPVVLKPCFKENYYERTKKKAVAAPDRERLIAEFQQMTTLISPSQIVIQELIPSGPRHLYSFVGVFDGQHIVSGMSARRSRQHPMDFGHATTFAESVDLPEIEELATRFLRAIEYRGIAEVEFMFDLRTNNFKFIEMNGRVWGWHTLAKAAGVNLPYALYALSLGRETAATSAAPGVKWIRALTDTPIVLGELLRGRMSVADYLRSFQGQTEFAVFSWNDPLPALMELVLAPYLWWKKGF